MINDEYAESYIESIDKLEKVIESESFKEVEEMIDQVILLLPKFYCPYYARPRLSAISLYLQEKNYKPFTIMPSKTLKEYIELYTKEHEYNKEKNDMKFDNYRVFSLFAASMIFIKIFV